MAKYAQPILFFSAAHAATTIPRRIRITADEAAKPKRPKAKAKAQAQEESQNG